MLLNGYDYFYLGMKYDAVIFDVDNKDIITGLSSPPPSFVVVEVLQEVKNILSPKGNHFILIALEFLNFLERKNIHNHSNKNVVCLLFIPSVIIFGVIYFINMKLISVISLAFNHFNY